MKRLLITMLFWGLILHTAVHAQWSANPSQNMMLTSSDSTYAHGIFQVNPQDSCYYHLYYVNDTEVKFKLFLQKFTFQGEAVWEEKGILIHTETNRSWTPNIGLAFNHDDCLYIAYSKTKVPAGTLDTLDQLHINKISNQGVMQWGEDGIVVSDDNFLADYVRQLVVTNDNNVLIGFDKLHDDQSVGAILSNVQVNVYNPDGSLMSSFTAPIEESEMNWGVELATLENGEVMALYRHNVITKPTDTTWLHEQAILAQKLNANGIPVFDEPKQVFLYPVYSETPMSPIHIQKDNEGGLYFATFYENEYFVIQLYVQRLNSLAETMFPIPVEVSTLNEFGIERASFGLGYFNETSELLAVWIEKKFQDPSNASNQILAQKFDISGQRSWDDEGKALSDLELLSEFRYAFPEVRNTVDNDVILFYLRLDMNAYVDVTAERIDSYGNPVWDEPSLLSDAPTIKGIMQVTDLIDGQFVATWNLFDPFNSGKNMLYGQNIFNNGQIGLITSITETSKSELSAKVYPNPATDQLTVLFDLPAPEDVEIKLFTFHGQLLSSIGLTKGQAGANQVIVDIEKLPAGAYYLQINTSGSYAVKKILVAK